MPEGTLLPPVAAKPANLAAPTAAGATNTEDVADAGAPTFGEVLKDQMSRADAAETAPATAPDAETAPATAEPQSDAGLAGLLTMLTDVTPAATAMPGEVSHAVSRRSAVDETLRASRRSDRSTIEAAVQTGARRESLLDVSDAVTTQAEGRDDHRGPAVDFQSFRPEQALKDIQGAALTSARASNGLRDLSEPVVVAPSSTVPTSHGAGLEGVKGLDAARQAEAPTTRTTVNVPVGKEGWGDAVADRVTWVMQSRQPVAELQLNPPDLGPVEVRVSMNGDQASVSFFSAHAPVREALQQAVPRLNEAFASAGVSLGDVFVGADPRSGQQQSDGRQRGSRRNDLAPAVEGIAAPVSPRWTTGLAGIRAVDLFA